MMRHNVPSQAREPMKTGAAAPVVWPSVGAANNNGLSWCPSFPQAVQSNLLITPDVQHRLGTARGIANFSQQTADDPWKPGLTNVHARHSRSRLQSLRQACALPGMAMLRISLPGRSVFAEKFSPCAEAAAEIPKKATTNADAIIRPRRHIATSCSKLICSLSKRFPILTAYELAHRTAASTICDR